MIALVDCNNFYASCERVFRPGLNGKPIAVLSNNDGCVIARSQEAKDLGVEMGEPYFKRKDWFAQQGIHIFSSNYPLYGDMSRRVMDTLGNFAPQVEVYSIDEAFLDYINCPYIDLMETGLNARATVFQHTGIPVSVGIAPTKTLAKLANKRCKKDKIPEGVLLLDSQDKINQALSKTPVEDVWGIGSKYAFTLRQFGIDTALKLANANDGLIRKYLTVVGLKLVYELRGINCFEIDTEPPPKKNICTSRSFGSNVSSLEQLKEAVSNYAARCAMKLREQHSTCSTIQVFLQTNPFNVNTPQRYLQQQIKLPEASNDTAVLIAYATSAIEAMFVPGLTFKKAGVLVLDLAPQKNLQTSLFDTIDHPMRQKLMRVMDDVNKKIGKEKIKLAIQGNEDMSPHLTSDQYDESKRAKWKLRRSQLSPCYTTRWDHIIKIVGSISS